MLVNNLIVRAGVLFAVVIGIGAVASGAPVPPERTKARYKFSEAATQSRLSGAVQNFPGGTDHAR